MRRLSGLILGVAVLGWLQAPVGAQVKKVTPGLPPIKVVEPMRPSYRHLDGQMLVFVVNGAGGSTTLSDNLLDLNEEQHLKLRIQMVPWARHNSPHQDLTDQNAQINAAARIACAIKAIRKDAPNAHFFLVGNSAGTRVVLAAAEMLPARSVDRIILLASAVSCTYDLTGALKASRYGIDNFYSKDDGILQSILENGITADGLKKVPAAGLVGFQCVASDKKDIEAYRALRQYRWTMDYAGSGGHFAWTLRHNLKKTVVPMFFCAPVTGGVMIESKMKVK